MRTPSLPAWLRRLLVATSIHPWYPLVVAFLAFGITLTFSFPFGALLIPAALLAPQRWLALGLLSGIASGAGAALLVEMFHQLGWEAIAARYPELVNTESWQWASDWLTRYGLVAIALIAASPFPQTPALLVYAMVNPSIAGVLLAVGLGKMVKYTALTYLTAKYPGRFVKFRTP